MSHAQADQRSHPVSVDLTRLPPNHFPSSRVNRSESAPAMNGSGPTPRTSLVPCPVDLAEILPETIRCRSPFPEITELQIVVRELPSAGEMNLPSGTSHFWLAFRPVEMPQRMEISFTDHAESRFADRGLQFFVPGKPHFSRWRCGDGKVAHIHFQKEFLHRIAASVGVSEDLLEKPNHREVTLQEPLEELCRLLMREAEGGYRQGSQFLLAAGNALALALVRNLATAELARTNPRVEHAARLLEQCCREKISMERFARALGFGRHRFFKEFRATFGVSPHAYLIQCRLRRACQLLASDSRQRSLADVAVAAGFSDQTHLTRHFRRAFGKTPGRWTRGH